MLAGCATSSAPSPRFLPAAPSDFGKPVAVPPVKAGDDARAVAARSLAALRQANSRLRDDWAFYADVQRNFGGGQ